MTQEKATTGTMRAFDTGFPTAWGRPPLLGGPAAMRTWLRSRIELARSNVRAGDPRPAWLAPFDAEPGVGVALRLLHLEQLRQLYDLEASWAEDEERRSAVPVHHSAIIDAPWHPAISEGHLKNGDVTSFKAMYAWFDPNAADPNGDGYPDSKSSWSLPHHEVSNGGRVGPANLDACSGAIGVLNGARGGTGIPQAERPDVWLHLATHLRDAGVSQPAALRMSPWSGAAARRMLELLRP